MLHHAKVMGDKQKGDAKIVAQIGKQVDDLRLDRDIQRRDRLVGNDKVGVENQRPGNTNTLALTARELMRKAVVVVGREAADLHHRNHFVIQLRPAAQFMLQHGFANRLADANPRVQ